MISPTEALILSLLVSKPRGAYGSELLHASDGKLKRGSVYTLLSRLEKAGLVRATEEPAQDTYALPRTIYQITGSGVKARQELGEFTGFLSLRGST